MANNQQQPPSFKGERASLFGGVPASATLLSSQSQQQMPPFRCDPFGYPNTDAADLELVKSLIGVTQNFPKEGVTFYDVGRVMQNPRAFSALDRLMTKLARSLGPFDVVVGLDARGFYFAPTLAHYLGCAFVPMRKQGKLPGPVVSFEYSTVYSTATFEITSALIPCPGARFLIVDDVVETGGSMKAARELVEGLGGIVVALAVVKIGVHPDIHSLITY
jgi:adenine phosphoribosyltransferase